MKGLISIPSFDELEDAYEKLLHATPTLDELTLYSQWSRLDPRLAEIWVRYLSEHWVEINPIAVYAALRDQPWGNAAAVLLEFVENAIPRESREQRRLFHLWQKTVTAGLNKANWEQFFIGHRGIAGKSMVDDARFSIAEYRKWGYLSREILFNKERASNVTHSFDPSTRREILKNLIVSQDSPARISTDLYWNAIGRSISRRQAERDLKIFKLLRPRGNTKGRYFVRKKSQA